MKTNRLLIAATSLFIGSFVASCNHFPKDNIQEKKIVHHERKDIPFEFVGQIPDSLRTPVQREYLKRLYRVIYDHMEVENNHQVLKLGKKEFLATGLTENDYDRLQEEIRTTIATLIPWA